MQDTFAGEAGEGREEKRQLEVTSTATSTLRLEILPFLSTSNGCGTGEECESEDLRLTRGSPLACRLMCFASFCFLLILQVQEVKNRFGNLTGE